MRDLSIDEGLIGTNQAADFDIVIDDGHVIAFADQALGKGYQR